MNTPICAGASIGKAATLTAQAAERLLLPLLAAQSSPLMTEARRSELATDTAGQLLALRMWRTIARLMQSAAEAICGREYTDAAAAAHSGWAGHSGAGVPEQPRSQAGGGEAAAAEQLGRQLKRLALAAAPLAAISVAWQEPQPAQTPVLARAAVPLLCQLVAAVTAATAPAPDAAAVAEPATAACPGQQSEHNVRDPEEDAAAAQTQAGLAANICLVTVQRLLALQQPQSRRCGLLLRQDMCHNCRNVEMRIRAWCQCSGCCLCCRSQNRGETSSILSAALFQAIGSAFCYRLAAGFRNPAS